MKKLITLLIAVAMCACVGCAQQPAERLVVMEPYTTASIASDLSNLAVLIEKSDIIVRGVVTKTHDLKYSKADGAFIADVKFDYTTVYKGDPDKNKLKIYTSGGYIPVEEYRNNNGFPVDRQPWFDKLSDNEKANGYVLNRFDGKTIYEEGKEYITFLREEPDGRHYPLGTGYGVLEVDGEYLNQTPGGHEYTIERVEQRLAELVE